MTASCGFGRSVTGTRRNAAANAAAAGRRENRGANKADGAARNAVNASRRWRRTNRSVSPDSSRVRVSVSSGSIVAGPADPGNATASSSALETRSPSDPSASTARAVSPSRGRARTPAISQPSRPSNGIAAPSIGAASIGANLAIVQMASSATKTVARAIHPRRTRRRIQRRRRCGRSEARNWISAGSNGAWSVLIGSTGTTVAWADIARGRRPTRRARAARIAIR